MFKLVATASSLLLTFSLFAPSAAYAATIVNVLGNTNGALATATAEITLNAGGGSITGKLTNTSPFSADITGFGFDLIPGDFTGNNDDGLDGYSGTTITNFDFEDGELGNVPQFNTAVLDFGYLTGNNFSGGTPNLFAPGTFVTFTVTGPFASIGLDEQEIAAALFVRFQDVGANGQLSDVGRPGPPTVVPEPASMMLFGTGLMYLARRKMRKNSSV